MTTATMAPGQHSDDGPSSSYASRPAQSARSSSVQSSSRSRQRSHSTRGFSADDEEFDDDEGAYDGDDGDGDEDDEEGDEAAGAGEDLMSETTVKSGYLMKRGEKRKNWKKRWFALRSSKLCYYKNEKEYQLLRFIDMVDVHTIAPITLTKRSDSCFGIVTSKRQYYVRAANAKEMQSWVDALREVREQVRQRSTLTQDMAAMNVGSPKSSTSPKLQPADRQANQSLPSTASGANSASPINIVIPGKGVYSAPAQPRTATSPSGNHPVVVSPLTATSDSDTGGPWNGGAEQFGLSYASSTGQSMASSPSRGGSGLHIHGQHQPLRAGGDAISSGGHSPQSHSGGEWSEGAIRRSRQSSKNRPTDNRDPSVGSSGGEGTTTGWIAAVGSPPQGGQNLVVSSSEEDDEGEDWDEGETADRAMPLPSSSAVHQQQAHHSAQQQSAQQQQPVQQQQLQQQSQEQTSRPPLSAIFLKDPNKVIHQGYLMKQSNRRKHWRKRWFILTGNQLTYTRSHMDGKPHRQIPLSSILDALEYTSSKKQPANGGAGVGGGAGAGTGAGVGPGQGIGGTGVGSIPAPSSPTGLQSPPAAGSLSFSLGSQAAGSDAGRAGGSGFTGSSANTESTGASTPHVEASTPTPNPERRASFIGAAAGAVASTVTGGAVGGSGGGGGGGGGGGAAGSSGAAGDATAAGGAAKHDQHQGNPPKRKKENCFKIITPKRTYVVCAPSEEEEIKWLSALQALLAHMRNVNNGGGGGSAGPAGAAASGGSNAAPLTSPGSNADSSAQLTSPSAGGSGFSQTQAPTAPGGPSTTGESLLHKPQRAPASSSSFSTLTGSVTATDR